MIGGSRMMGCDGSQGVMGRAWAGISGEGEQGVECDLHLHVLTAQPGESDLLIIFQTLVSLSPPASEDSLTPARAWNEASG